MRFDASLAVGKGVVYICGNALMVRGGVGTVGRAAYMGVGIDQSWRKGKAMDMGCFVYWTEIVGQGPERGPE